MLDGDYLQEEIKNVGYIWFLNNLFLTIKLFIATIYNDVQIRWVFTFYQSCHGSQVRKLVFARPSGLNGVGEEVKLVSLG